MENKLTTAQEKNAVDTMKDMLDGITTADAINDAARSFLDDVSGFETDQRAHEVQAKRLVALYNKSFPKK